VSTGSCSVERIDTYEDLCTVGREWQALEVAARANLPFQTWEWSTSWWKYLHEDRSAVRDLMHVCVVRAPTGELIGVAPLMLTERPSFGPLRLRILQYFGADPNITELRSILCFPGRAADCYRAIQAHLAEASGDWDWIAWEGHDVESSAGMGHPLHDIQPSSAYILPLAPTWQEMKHGFRRNIKESLRHCYNSLKRDGRTYQLDVSEDPADIARRLPEFFRLHAARAQLTDTLTHTDVFESPLSQAFLVDVSVRLAERGAAKLFELRVDDRVVATRVGFELANTLYLYYSGWDPAYRHYSVMTTLTAEIIQFAIQRGLQAVHLSTGTDVSKTRWGAQEVRYVSGVQLSARPSSRATYALYQTALRPGVARRVRALLPLQLIRKSHTSRRPRPTPLVPPPAGLQLVLVVWSRLMCIYCSSNGRRVSGR
jgi:CelD/BcsL family acetyltransferase involved in cellulose biosynthesis